jgi:hypothetical protein
MYRSRMTSAPPDAMQPTSFRDIIARWPTTRAFARDAGSSPTLVRQWRHRNFVPAPYWQRIVEGAGRRGLAQVDIGLLARLAASRRANGGRR